MDTARYGAEAPVFEICILYNKMGLRVWCEQAKKPAFVREKVSKSLTGARDDSRLACYLASIRDFEGERVALSRNQNATQESVAF